VVIWIFGTTSACESRSPRRSGSSRAARADTAGRRRRAPALRAPGLRDADAADAVGLRLAEQADLLRLALGEDAVFSASAPPGSGSATLLLGAGVLGFPWFDCTVIAISDSVSACCWRAGSRLAQLTLLTEARSWRL